jgi:hypothetical protein
MTYKRGIVFYKVSLPRYEPYKKLSSPICRVAAKKILISGGDSLLNLEFLQEDGTEEQSFSFTLPFSKKNIEIELGKLFDEFSLLLP